MKKKLIIAIDGYSSCGKSTFAKAIASDLNYIFIDSGAMYRAVTLFYMRKSYAGKEKLNIPGILSTLNEIHLDFVYNQDLSQFETFMNSENVEQEIRSINVSQHVSEVSKIHQVRSKMVELQRQIGVNKGIVMDGRDIGTVVFPEADLKIFMTASLDVRTKRRYDELKSKGIDVDFNEIRKNLIARDITDENRDISPLRRADDALILDNSFMTIADQMIWVKEIIDKKINES